MLLYLLHPITLSVVQDDKFNELKEKIRTLIIEGETLLNRYKTAHSSSQGCGNSSVRFEYCFGFQDEIRASENYMFLPVKDTIRNTSPLDALLKADIQAVYDDVQKTTRECLFPMLALAGLSRATLKTLVPAVRTTYVYHAEKFQQKVNSTDPGLLQIQKYLVDKKLIGNYGRPMVPLSLKSHINDEITSITGLDYVVQTKILPASLEFNANYEPVNQRLKRNFGYISSIEEQEIQRLNDPTMLRYVLCQFNSLQIDIFFDSNREVGLMESYRYERLIDKTDEEKQDVLKTLADFVVKLYHYEMKCSL